MGNRVNTSIDRRYDMLRKRAEQDVREQTQEQQRGLKRQFARLGGIGTGAFVKQQRLAQESGQKRLGEAQQNIDFQRMAELERQQQIEEQRQFQRGEREAGQQFAAEQLGRQQEFARSERLGAQEFGATQAELQRKFARGERVAAQDFQKGLFDIEQQNTLKKLDLAEKQFGMENTVNMLNARLQIAEGIEKGLFKQSDLEAIAGLFMGGSSGQAQTISLTQFGQGSETIPAEKVDALRNEAIDIVRRSIRPGSFANPLNQRSTNMIYERARQLGMTPRQVREAGIIDFLRSERGFRAATGR